MEFEKNTLLFGSDPTPRIVAIELGETGTVKVYRREKDGGTTCDIEEFHPFVWLDSDVADLDIDAEKLAGDLRYGWLKSVDSWKELIALRNGLKKAGRSFFALSDPVQHYLTHTGRTLFKQLPFEELRRLQLEVLSPTGENDLAQASQTHIASIALSDNSGWEELIIVDPKNADESEHDAIKRLTSIIKERDPDVIEGHDLFRFDLPYLVARARKAKTKLDWGRSGGFLRSRPSRLQIAEKTIDYPKFSVEGRHFVDTFLLAQFYDVGLRTLSGFERVDVARHFGFCDSEELSALTGKELERAYAKGSEKFRKRAICARARNACRFRSAQSELFHPGADFSLQLSGRDRARKCHPHQRALSARIFSSAAFHSGNANGPWIRRRLHRYFLYRRRAQRLALRHRLALSVDHAAVRLLSGDAINSRSSAICSPICAHFGCKRRPTCAAPKIRNSSAIFTRCKIPSRF